MKGVKPNSNKPPSLRGAEIGCIYAARSNHIDEQEYLKIGFTTHAIVGMRFPLGDFDILFSLPDVQDSAEYGQKDWRFRHTGGVLERSVLHFCGELDIMIGVENGYRSNKRATASRSTELVRFDLEAVNRIRTKLHKATPEVRRFLNLLLRFANPRMQRQLIIGFDYDYTNDFIRDPEVVTSNIIFEDARAVSVSERGYDEIEGPFEDEGPFDEGGPPEDISDDEEAYD